MDSAGFVGGISDDFSSSGAIRCIDGDWAHGQCQYDPFLLTKKQDGIEASSFMGIKLVIRRRWAPLVELVYNYVG